MILYGSSISDGNVHTHHDLPLVLVGGGNGQIKGGRHVRYKPETPMNNLLVSDARQGRRACGNAGRQHR